MRDAMPKNVYDAFEHPKRCAPDDFWGQVRRTVNGKTIPQEQINMIYSMIRDALQFSQDDVLLDLCCGNGVLGMEFFGEVKEYLGVDMSPSLIAIGEENFQRVPSHIFLNQMAIDFCENTPMPERFTKALWFSAFSYFTDTDALRVLSLLHKRFTNLARVFIGSQPDTNLAGVFWREKEIPDLTDHTSAIGKWRTRDEFIALVKSAGWQVEIPKSPEAYYQASYRFNALLVR